MRLAIMGGVVLGLIGFLVFFATKLSTPNMTTLYGELAQADAAGIVQELQTRNIPFEIKQNGTQIMVPQDQVMQLRLELAQQGLPSGGSIGYELFDHADSLGSTNFMQNVNLVRALEGELSRTISSINTVKNARVHLVMPRRELFSREKQEPSASIVLQMRGPIRLSAEQVAAVQHLVASAVPQLTPTRISIIDNKGSLLSSGFESADPIAGVAAKADQRRQKIEANMSHMIEELLEKTIGFGRVRAEVNVAMNFDRVSTQTEEYNPDGQVVRSTNAVTENSSAKDSEGQTPISVGTNLPDANLGGSDSASRTDLKRESFELQKLGEDLLQLRQDAMQQLVTQQHVPELLFEAIRDAKKITNFEGLRRQMQYVGKLMRKLDASQVQAIRDALDVQHNGSAEETLALHMSEHWRDRLLKDDQALADWLIAHPDTDSQQLRALIRQARKDGLPDKSAVSQGAFPRQGRAYRDIFKLVRDQLNAAKVVSS